MKTRMFLAAVAVVMLVAVATLRADEKKKDIKCPVSGQPCKAEHKTAFNDGEVHFCCPNCLKKFEEDSKPFAAKANLQLAQTGQLKQVACPLSGKPAADDKVVEVEGVKVGVCCGGCLAKAKKLEGAELISLLFNGKGFEPVKK